MRQQSLGRFREVNFHPRCNIYQDLWEQSGRPEATNRPACIHRDGLASNGLQGGRNCSDLTTFKQEAKILKESPQNERVQGKMFKRADQRALELDRKTLISTKKY